MTRLRICRGIALLASLAAACAGEAGPSSKISARFLDSVEQAAPPSMEERPLAEIDGEADRIVGPGGKRRLSWWSFAIQVVHPPHPPPPHHDSSSGGGGGGGGGGGSGSGGSGSGGNGTSTKKSMLAPGSLPFWMLIAAASAAAVAIAAGVIGSRRRGREDYHPLKGSIERRMKLFGGMADGCYEGRELCGAQNEVGAEGMNDSGIAQEAEYKEMV